MEQLSGRCGVLIETLQYRALTLCKRIEAKGTHFLCHRVGSMGFRKRAANIAAFQLKPSDLQSEGVSPDICLRRWTTVGGRGASAGWLCRHRIRLLQAALKWLVEPDRERAAFHYPVLP